MKLLENIPHSGVHEHEFSTTRAANMSEMIDAFNAFLLACGYHNQVTLKEDEDETAQ
jgi:hypothetical protein